MNKCPYCDTPIPRKGEDRYYNHLGVECCSAWCCGATMYHDGREFPYYSPKALGHNQKTLMNFDNVNSNDTRV